MSYTTKEGRAILRRHHQIPDLSRKWTGILPAHHDFRWTTVWTRDRSKKEAGLIWLTWNRAVAVNDWRGRVNGIVDRNCHVCDTGACESVLHRFWECPQAQKAWLWATHVLNKITLTSPASAWRGPWRPFHWKEALFSHRIPRRFRPIEQVWSLLRGVVMWTLWLSRNDVVFNGILWTDAKLF